MIPPLAFVTGGFRSAKAMAEALQNGALDIIGLARSMVLYPDMPNRILSGEDYVSPVKPFISTSVKALDRALMISAETLKKINITL